MMDKSSSREYGSVHGRFQGLHLGHEEYLLAAMERSSYLFVGLAMPDPSDLRGRNVAAHRHERTNNPFTFYERDEMVRACLHGGGYCESQFRTYPFPIDDLSSISNYLPRRADLALYITVYDEWGEYKVRVLREIGYDVSVLWRRDPATKVATGTQLRQHMRQGKDFSHLVSSGVASVVDDLGLADKLRLEEIDNQLSNPALFSLFDGRDRRADFGSMW